MSKLSHKYLKSTKLHEKDISKLSVSNQKYCIGFSKINNAQHYWKTTSPHEHVRFLETAHNIDLVQLVLHV